MHPIYNNYADGWKGFFSKRNSHVLWLHWSRGFTWISKMFAKKRLRHLLRTYKSYDVTLLGMSLGGEIALETAKKFPNIKKIILIGSTNEKASFNLGGIEIINLYSTSDIFQKFAIHLLSPFFGSVCLKGKGVKNVNLPGITHDKFFANNQILSGKFKGKKISEVIESFIER